MHPHPVESSVVGEVLVEQFVIIKNVILIHNILSIFVIHYVIKLIYEEN
jgi:hypothetical protein